MQAFIAALADKLSGPLPGQEAQFSMAHVVRQSRAPVPDDVRMAGVLILFFPKAEAWHTVMIQRTSRNPKDRHGGQISFPGGKYEAADQTLMYTALRETEEEIGVARNAVQVLGQLTDLYIPVSNFLVHPFVGYMDEAPAFVPEVKEVQQVLEIPFAHFQDVANLQKTSIRIRENMILQEVPHFLIDGHVVWGATAMIMGELLALIDGNGAA